MGMSASQARLLTITARLSDIEFQSQQLANSRTRLADRTQQVSNDYSDALDKKKLTIQTGSNNGAATYTDMSYALLTSNKLTVQYGVSDANGNLLVTQDMASKFEFAQGNGGLNDFLALCMDASNIKVSNSSKTGADYQTTLKQLMPCQKHYDELLTTDPAKATLYFNTTIQPLETQLGACGKATINTGSDNTYYTNLYNRMTQGYTTESNESATLGSNNWLETQLKEGNLYLEKFDTSNNNGKGGFAQVPFDSDTSIVQQSDDVGLAEAKAKYDQDMANINNKDKRMELELKQLDTEHSAIQTEYDAVKKVLDKSMENGFKTFNTSG